MSSEEYYASEFSDEYLPAHGYGEAHLLVSVSDFYTSAEDVPIRLRKRSSTYYVDRHLHQKANGGSSARSV